MPTRHYSHSDYLRDFCADENIRKNAYHRALEIRRFEIDLYWRRASYFWTFIAATFAGFVAVQVSSAENKVDMAVLISCVGIVFSFAWYCVNKGSKFWQENWENHVDLLENEEVGPLYKVILRRRKPQNFGEILEEILIGPSGLSVSKINQIVSIFVVALWVVLLFYSLPNFNANSGMNIFYAICITISVVACATFVWKGKTYTGGYWHRASIRTSSIHEDSGKT